MKKILNLTSKHQNIETFLQKVTLQIGLMKFLWLQKVKNSKPWTYVIEDLNGEVIFGTFYEKRIAKDKSNKF